MSGPRNYLGMRAYRYADVDTGELIIFYRHPNGQKIRRERRDWNAYGVLGAQGGTSAGPKESWEVYDSRDRWVNSFVRLRDAKAFCDEHPAPASSEPSA